MVRRYDFSGLWRSSHRKAADSQGPEIVHYMILRSVGDQLIMESISSLTGTYLLARFSLDGRIATGSYQSQHRPADPRDTALELYHGAAQLILSKDGKVFRGQGVGFDRHMAVSNTLWEVAYIGQHASAGLPQNRW